MTEWAGEMGASVHGVDSHLMMVVRQSTKSCFFCLETGAHVSRDSFSEASDSSVMHFLFGSILG